MSNPYLGEIRMFGGTFAPAGWAFCDGAIVAISQNDTLFMLIGTTYGGDGEETFALPDLQGRFPMHMGTGPGLTTRVIGEKSGTESVTLTVNQIPSHTHVPVATSGGGDQRSPAGRIWAASSANNYSAGPPNTAMAPNIVGPAGGNQPHDNMMPFLTISFIISLFGIFPSQT